VHKTSRLLFDLEAYHTFKAIKYQQFNMAVSQAANVVEKVVGHGDNATITTDVSNYNNEYGMESGPLIKATTWQGKNKVSVGRLALSEKHHVI
jgi:hypothetical protein